MELAVRPATSADAAAILAVIAAVAAEDRFIATQVPFDREQRTRDLAAALDEGRAYSFVVETPEGIVGELTLRLRDGVAQFGMGVDHSHRGCGAGGRLLNALIAWANVHGTPALRMDVFEHNTAAIRLYRSRGFAETGERKAVGRANGEVWQAIGMQLRIDAT